MNTNLTSCDIDKLINREETPQEELDQEAEELLQYISEMLRFISTGDEKADFEMIDLFAEEICNKAVKIHATYIEQHKV